MHARTSSLALAVAVVGLASGCAFGNREARLIYPSPDVVPIPASASTGARVAIQSLTDLRPEPIRVIGWVRNGFHQHTADVVTSDDVAGWAVGALRTELKSAGVEVVEPGPGTPLLGADLSKVFCDAYWSYSGTVSLRVWIDDPAGKRLLDKTYEAEDSYELNMAAVGAGYARCVARAMQKAAREIAAEASSALQGAAPASPSPAPST